MFGLGVSAVRLIEADRTMPKYHRLGMARIAWIMGVSLRSTYNWWDAYKKGGASALRNNMWRPGPKPKVEPEVLEELAMGLLERRRHAGGVNNKGGAEPAGAPGRRPPRTGTEGAGPSPRGRLAGGRRGRERKGRGRAHGGAWQAAAADGNGRGGAEPTGAPGRRPPRTGTEGAGPSPRGRLAGGRRGGLRRGRRLPRLPGRGRQVVHGARRGGKVRAQGLAAGPVGRDEVREPATVQVRRQVRDGRAQEKAQEGPQVRRRHPVQVPCRRPTKLPPAGPPHLPGCPALCTAPPDALLPEEFGEAIRERRASPSPGATCTPCSPRSASLQSRSPSTT